MTPSGIRLIVTAGSPLTGGRPSPIDLSSVRKAVSRCNAHASCDGSATKQWKTSGVHPRGAHYRARSLGSPNREIARGWPSLLDFALSAVVAALPAIADGCRGPRLSAERRYGSALLRNGRVRVDHRRRLVALRFQCILTNLVKQLATTDAQPPGGMRAVPIALGQHLGDDTAFRGGQHLGQRRAGSCFHHLLGD